MRIEVGYGLEPTLTDAKSKRITSAIIKPLFQRGDLAGGIEAGTAAMLSTIRGAEFTGSGATHAQSASAVHTIPCGVVIFIAIALLLVLFVVIRRNRSAPGIRSGSTPSDDSSGSSWTSSDSSSSSSSSSDFSGGGGDGGGGGSSDSW